MKKNEKKSTSQPGEIEGLGVGPKEERALLDECAKHESDSYKSLETIRGDWDDKESMLLPRLRDGLSKTTKSQVFDPILSSMLIERGSRVMATPGTGKAFAVSKDDLGKNMVMNLLLKYYRTNANEGRSHLIKLRQLDVYSGIYGSMFGLVPWRINSLNGYVGPELLLIEMRNIRPQPGKKTIDESDFFGVRSKASVAWLLRQQEANPEIWVNCDKMAAQMKQGKSEGDTQKQETQEKSSFVERELYPSIYGDAVFPEVELFTEYRCDMWITWTPRQISNDKSMPWILRIVRNPYPEGMLPIVSKDGFPLIDSMIGLGEFERGKTLQFAANSLINLYMEGVKYSIFPPLHINPDNVVPSSIVWKAGNKWFMNNPNVDVQAMQMNPQGLQTFQSTYGYMASAIQNLFGSTQVTQMEGSELSLGKTPEAIKQRGFTQSARDEWDRFMMEQTIDAVYTRWIALATHSLEAPQLLRVYEAEIEDIKKLYPKEDILTVFKSGKRGNLKVDKKVFMDGKEPVKFDFELEVGSTMKKNLDEELGSIKGVLDSLGLKVGPRTLLEELRAQGKDIDIAETYKQWLILGGNKNWDKILITPEKQLNAGGQVGADGTIIPSTSAAAPGPTGEVVPPAAGGPPAEVTPPAPAGRGATPENAIFKDKEIAAAAAQIFGGMQGIPPAA